jgi:hypothetical protein
MKPRVAPICIAFAALAFAGGVHAQPAPALAQPAEKAGPASTTPDATQPLTFAEAQKAIAATRRYVAHPSPAEKDKKSPAVPVEAPFTMAEPPPPAPAESVPVSPVTGHVWVPGHYMPFEGKWRWVRGEWAAPATSVSVWIPARYDPKEKKWTPGYWQPDRPPTPDTYPTGKDAASPSPNE